MRRIFRRSVGVSLLTAWVLVQSAYYVSAVQNTSVGVTVPRDTALKITDTGPNHSVWEQTTYEATADGGYIAHPHKYTELCTGLNYWNGTNWTPSQEVINILPDGTASATQGQQQVYFPADIYEGAIQMVTPDGKTLRSRPLGLSYDDGTSTVLIAELTNSIGYLANSNQVVYPNAFMGVDADLLYTYTRSGFEQDIILRSQPPAPAADGLVPETTKIQVLTEFFNPPNPQMSRASLVTDAGTVEDDQLNFGIMHMVQGRAFLINEADPAVRVTKQWTVLSGRQFLVEEVPTASMGDMLEQLPAPSSQVKVNVKVPTIAKQTLLPPQRLVENVPVRKPIRMLRVGAPKTGLVLDYVTVNTSQTNYVFQGDATYFISGSVNLVGTNTFEGGAVIKYSAGGSISAPAPMIFTSGIYHPVVFTAKDDNTVGDTISGSSGNPSGYYANPAISVTGSGLQTLSNFKASYAQSAISSSAVTLTVNNAQFVNCGSGITAQNHPLAVNNGLFVNLQTNLVLNAVAGTVNQATFDNANYLLGAPNTGSLYLTNSVLVNITNVSGINYANYNGFFQTTTFGGNVISNGNNPFQQVGGARCYLASGSSFLNAGTPGVGATILTQLKMRTTHAPLVISNVTYSVPLYYGPVVQRDFSAYPDLGYHYDPLDYAFGGVVSYSNIVFNAGTAVGWFELASGGNYGIAVYDNAVVSLNGTATQPCVVARYSSVQEGGTGIWQTKGTYAAITAESLSGGYSMSPANAAQIWPTFTKHYALAYDPCIYRENNALTKVTANNSEFYTGPIGAYWTYFNVTNCLFDRGQVNSVGGNASQVVMRNCSFHGGSVSISKSSSWPVWFEECAFDATALAVNGNSSDPTNVTYCDFNAYLSSTTNHLPVMGSHSISITNFNWQASYLGKFYPNCPQMIDVGSQSAPNFGLYHFTTKTSQAKEAATTVDIGYHYVATDANGNPIDTNSDGIPDYLEDVNGNGSVDSGEIGWNITGDTGLQVIISRPRNGSSLP